jgi:hypothetical protein
MFPTNLRDTLLVLPPVQGRPRDPTRVLALQEKTLGLAILESENLAVTTDVELALENSVSIRPIRNSSDFMSKSPVVVQFRGVMRRAAHF